MKKENSIEDAFVQIEEIIMKLEATDTPLEESFKIYEEGMRLIKGINSKIDKVEKKMIVLEEGMEKEE